MTPMSVARGGKIYRGSLTSTKAGGNGQAKEFPRPMPAAERLTAFCHSTSVSVLRQKPFIIEIQLLLTRLHVAIVPILDIPCAICRVSTPLPPSELRMYQRATFIFPDRRGKITSHFKSWHALEGVTAAYASRWLTFRSFSYHYEVPTYYLCCCWFILWRGYRTCIHAHRCCHVLLYQIAS